MIELMRVRDVFMMCVYGCGLPLGKLKQALAAEPGSGMMDDDVDAACGFARFPAAKARRLSAIVTPVVIP